MRAAPKRVRAGSRLAEQLLEIPCVVDFRYSPLCALNCFVSPSRSLPIAARSRGTRRLLRSAQSVARPEWLQLINLALRWQSTVSGQGGTGTSIFHRARFVAFVLQRWPISWSDPVFCACRPRWTLLNSVSRYSTDLFARESALPGASCPILAQTPLPNATRTLRDALIWPARN